MCEVFDAYLSNIVCIKLDERLSKYSGAKNIIYSRYADDMTFSAKNPERLIRAKKIIEIIINDEGFNLNHRKTRLIGPRQRRKITGLIISDSKIGIGKKQRKILRAAIYNYVNKPMTVTEKEELYSWLKGWLSYLKSVDKESMDKLLSYWNYISIKPNLTALS